MKYRSTKEVADDLRQHNRLIVIDEPISPNLEMAEIQRRVYASGGPAILFTKPLGCSFPMISNLFGSIEQARFLFRHTLERVRRAIELKIAPNNFFKQPTRYLGTPFTAWTMRPRKCRSGPALANSIRLSQLPQLKSWPDDGGSFVTLPQVLSQSVSCDATQLQGINLGMYRIQLSGNDYLQDQEAGLHYQIHRGIGVHHQEALKAEKPLKVNVFVGGSPAMTLAAVMPLPEGLSELTFAGAMAGYRIPMIVGTDHLPIYADADFCIQGEVDMSILKPEGPFGDHLGYYSLRHDFPYMRIKSTHHRPNAIWPFTVVGRPPQEDTTLGQLIHEITGPIIPTVLPGVKSIHAVDAAGVHPLLLAIGSERYSPYLKSTQPQELLTQSNAILGQGQLSLAKYLLIINGNDVPDLEASNISEFLKCFLERVDWSRDLHFQTRTTIDTLDYSGEGLNEGSKVVMAARGPSRRRLATSIPSELRLPDGFSDPRIGLPGIAVIQATSSSKVHELADRLNSQSIALESIPLIVFVNDSRFASESLNNLLWTIFTRSNPAADIDGVDSHMTQKHWGCHGSLIIDARIKPHHAPPLIENRNVSAKIDALAARAGPLARYL